MACLSTPCVAIYFQENLKLDRDEYNNNNLIANLQEEESRRVWANKRRKTFTRMKLVKWTLYESTRQFSNERETPRLIPPCCFGAEVFDGPSKEALLISNLPDERLLGVFDKKLQ